MNKRIALALLLVATSFAPVRSGLKEHIDTWSAATIGLSALAEGYAIHTLGSTDPHELQQSAIATAVANAIALGKVGVDEYRQGNIRRACRIIGETSGLIKEKSYTAKTDPRDTTNWTKISVTNFLILLATTVDTLGSRLFVGLKDISKLNNATSIAKHNEEAECGMRREKARQYLLLTITHLVVPLLAHIYAERTRDMGTDLENKFILIKSICLLNSILEFCRRYERYALDFGDYQNYEFDSDEVAATLDTIPQTP